MNPDRMVSSEASWSGSTMFSKLLRINLGSAGQRIARVKSGKFGHQVNSDTHLQTV